MRPIIRAAIESKIPPLSLLFEDTKRKYSFWDYRLIKALYINESIEVDGYPIYVRESKNIIPVPRKVYDPISTALEIAQERDLKRRTHKNGVMPDHGARWIVDLQLREGASWPTRQEWVDSRREKPAPDAAVQEQESQRAQEAEERATERIRNLSPEALAGMASVANKLPAKTQDVLRELGYL